MNNERLHPPAKRGFAAMSQERQRVIASIGGRVAHEKGTAHEWTAEEARLAAKKSSQHKRKNINRGENDGCEHIL